MHLLGITCRRCVGVLSVSPGFFFRAVIQRKINRPLMKPLNHIPVKTADRRLRGSQAWLEAHWSRSGEALEPSHFRFAILCTIDLGLTTRLSLNSLLTLWGAQVNSLIVSGSSLKDNLNSAFCLTPRELRLPTFWIGAVCVCVFEWVCVLLLSYYSSFPYYGAAFEHVMYS